MAAAVVAAFGYVRADDWAWGEARLNGEVQFALKSTNEVGAAVLSDADLAGKSVDEIVFTDRQPGADELAVGGIVLSNRTIRFTAKENLVLRGDGTNSVFRLSGSAGNWTLDGLDLQGVGMTDANPEFGGAVACFGGTLALSGCSFADFFASQVGGAVCAARTDGDVTVTNCSFASNGAGPYNGYGGAVYASAANDAARLIVADSEFAGNFAENGGAICTETRLSEAERPIAVVIRGGAVFEGNAAVFKGGAVLGEGTLEASGSNTVFSANAAGNDGGAICVDGIAGRFTPAKVTISDGVKFADNIATSDVVWTSGGAISVLQLGCELKVDRATFSNNVAVTACEEGNDQPALGGAIRTAEGGTNVFRKTSFVGNGVSSANTFGVGGAVSVSGGETTVDNCVFDCRGNEFDACYGSAVDFEGARGVVRNTTVRYGATEAISSVDANLEIVNCVTVGNAQQMGDGAADLLFEGESTVDMSYTAYGSCTADETATVAESRNLPNREAEKVYDGDTLRLDKTEFNPVVELGLVQPHATDFDGIVYQSSIIYGRASMGAYELETGLVIVLDVFGEKGYDSTTRSNGCVWTWKLTDTNGVDFVCDDLVPTNLTPAEASAFLAERFAITNWVFGTEANGGAFGLYDSTNEFGTAWYLNGGVEAVTDLSRWIGTLLKLRSHGEIRETWFVLPVDFGGGETNGVYFSWGWMKDNLDRYPTNDFEESCGILREAETNGYARWQNYVMGIDGTNPTNRIVTTYEAVGNPGARGSCVDVVTPFAASCNPPARVGVAAEYRLYNVTHTRRGILPEESDLGQKWHCYATNDVPRFANFDLSRLHYGLKDLDREYGQCLLEIYAIFKKGLKPEGAE